MTYIETEREREVRLLYWNLMSETRRRLDFLEVLYENFFKLPLSPRRELGYLQLRMICETVALACLVVHGDDLPGMNARIKSAHQADFILKRLEELHPRFFPEPGTPVPDPAMPDARKFEPSTDDYLTKSELITLYRQCGEHLHRGTYQNIGEPDETPPPFEPIRDARLRLVMLLRFHRIALIGTRDELWVHMVHPETSDVWATLEQPVH